MRISVKYHVIYTCDKYFEIFAMICGRYYSMSVNYLHLFSQQDNMENEGLLHLVDLDILSKTLKLRHHVCKWSLHYYTSMHSHGTKVAHQTNNRDV